MEEYSGLSVKLASKEWFAFHATSRSRLDSILKKGLIPSGEFGPYVFLAASKDLVSSYNEVILKIKLTERNIGEIKRNNKDFSFDEFALDYLSNEILPRYNLSLSQVIDDDEDLDMTIVNLEELKGIRANEIENEIFEAYFNSAELMVSQISSSQIVEIL